MLVKQYYIKEEHGQDMEHMKTQMDLLTKHLLAGSVEKVKELGLHSRAS